MVRAGGPLLRVRKKKKNKNYNICLLKQLPFTKFLIKMNKKHKSLHIFIVKLNDRSHYTK